MTPTLCAPPGPWVSGRGGGVRRRSRTKVQQPCWLQAQCRGSVHIIAHLSGFTRQRVCGCAGKSGAGGSEPSPAMAEQALAWARSKLRSAANGNHLELEAHGKVCTACLGAGRACRQPASEAFQEFRACAGC